MERLRYRGMMLYHSQIETGNINIKYTTAWDQLVACTLLSKSNDNDMFEVYVDHNVLVISTVETVQ